MEALNDKLERLIKSAGYFNNNHLISLAKVSVPIRKRNVNNKKDSMGKNADLLSVRELTFTHSLKQEVQFKIHDVDQITEHIIRDHQNCERLAKVQHGEQDTRREKNLRTLQAELASTKSENADLTSRIAEITDENLVIFFNFILIHFLGTQQ